MDQEAWWSIGTHKVGHDCSVSACTNRRVNEHTDLTEPEFFSFLINLNPLMCYPTHQGIFLVCVESGDVKKTVIFVYVNAGYMIIGVHDVGAMAF